jgi:phosphoribosylpyrophosphate synthetase
MSELLDLLRVSQRNISQLAEPAALQGLAERVVEFARARRVTSLLAASPVAERLVGAVLVAKPGAGAEQHDHETGDAVVLLVDVNLASGTSLSRAARRARRDGADRVLAVVLHRLAESQLDADDYGVDELVVLDDHLVTSPTV